MRLERSVFHLAEGIQCDAAHKRVGVHEQANDCTDVRRERWLVEIRQLLYRLSVHIPVAVHRRVRVREHSSDGTELSEPSDRVASLKRIGIRDQYHEGTDVSGERSLCERCERLRSGYVVCALVACAGTGIVSARLARAP